jgi:hypothetical protein
MTLTRAQVVLPELPQEEAACPELGGSVIVRGATLSTWLRLQSTVKTDRSRWIGEVLAVCVVDADGKALMSAEEWDRFAGVKLEAAMRLYSVAERMLATDLDNAEKK